MKVKHVLISMGLASLMVIGGGFAIAKTHRTESIEMKEVKATGETYYLTGETSETDSDFSCLVGFSWADAPSAISLSNDGASTPLVFAPGDEFKFVLGNGDWSGALGSADLLGSARGYFGAGSSGNVACIFGGTYNVSVQNSKLVIDCYSTHYADVYFQLNSNAWQHSYVYAFDELSHDGYTLEPLGAWPGTEITEVTDGINFAPNYSAGGGIGKIRIPYIYLSNIRIIFNNNDALQTQTLTVQNDYYYLQNTTSTYGDNTKGACAKTVYAIWKVIDSTVGKSACEVGKSAATAVLAEYESYLAYTYVLDSNYYTWKDGEMNDQKNFTFGEVIERLQYIAEHGSDSRSITLLGNSNTIILVVAISVGAISLAGLLLVLRRRRYSK